MHTQPATGRIKVLGAFHPLVEVSKLDPNKASQDDRFFTDKPVPVPGTNYSRKSFKRSELEGYKKE